MGGTTISQSIHEKDQTRLGPRRWARVEGWGMAVDCIGYLFQPTTIHEIKQVFETARRENVTIGLRGGGRSYGDAAINEGGIILDLTKMNRILSWNAESGIIETEPGVTIEQLWKSIIADGYWPPVVSGTMFTTMAGCAAMNIHGKNNYKAGPFGNHILDFDLLLPNGELITCSRDENSDYFHSAISGFGMLGCFTRLRLQMKKVHSGFVRVEAFNTKNLQEMVDEFEDRVDEADYLVGWIDCIAGGDSLGRGIVHRANYVPECVDPQPHESLRVTAQELPTRILGIPKSMMWMPLSLFTNNIGMRMINMAKFYSGYLQPRGHWYRQSHAGFAFLLDYVPNWKFSYKPGGLIQYQSFLPKDTAVHVFEKLLRLSQKEGMPSYLGVFKKHQPDPFLLTHSLDGYSLALDFKVTHANRKRLWDMCTRMNEIVLDGGGKFYFAKDSTLSPETVKRFFPCENIDKFVELKKQADPENILQTNLSRRLFSDYF